MNKTVKDDSILTLESKCENCIWYLGNHKCPAFSGDIPKIVWRGTHDTILKEQVAQVKYQENGPLL